MTEHPDGLPTPRRYFSILAIALAITMAVLDGAIVNVALPQITRELHATPVGAIWIVNAYQLAIAVSLLPLAAVGEMFGFRRVYQAGLLVFTLGSLGCALSHTLAALVAARVFQGLGAAGIMSMNGALVRFTYPGRMLGRAIGINAMVIAAAAAAGPSVASAILAVAPWEWLFAVNVPIGAVTLVVAAFALPASPLHKKRFDWVSAILNALAVGLLVLGAEGFAHGQGRVLSIAEVALALISLGLLAARELPRSRPLVPVDLLRIPIFGLSVLSSITSFTAQMLAYVALPFAFEVELHRTAVQTGLLMTPWPLATGITAALAGRLSDRMPAAILGGAGLAVFCGGLLALGLMPAQSGDLGIIWRMALCGAGFGLFQAPNNRTMIASAPRERSGAAGGMLATARLLGQTAGATGVALLFRFAPGGGVRECLFVAAGFAALGAVVSLTRLSATAPDLTQKTPPAPASGAQSQRRASAGGRDRRSAAPR
jgi:DHA2 family multidrug resistance protein-like MFS transporter